MRPCDVCGKDVRPTMPFGPIPKRHDACRTEKKRDRSREKRATKEQRRRWRQAHKAKQRAKRLEARSEVPVTDIEWRAYEARLAAHAAGMADFLRGRR